MIQANQTWTQALAQPQKQPYYAVEIPDFAITIVSYGASAVTSSQAAGYGAAQYGVAEYGS